MPCAAPGELTSIPTAKAVGLLAEDFIGEEYLRHRGRTIFFPGSLQDFQDVSLVFGNQQLHLGFLLANNPGKFRPGATIADVLADPRPVDGLRMKVPDLLNHIPERSATPERAEFYEIKPNSIWGRRNGRSKLRSLAKDYEQLKFPYTRGSVWKVDKKVSILAGNILGINVEANFHYYLMEDGLIVYEICIEGPMLKWIALALIIGILAAIIVIIIDRGRIPGFPPPNPPQLPPPQPAPSPIPFPPVPVPVPRLKFASSAGIMGFSDGVSRLLPSASPLSASVGVGGVNCANDVRLVQLLLNDWLASTKQQLLVVDGICGPKSNAAISSFQAVHTQFRDGRVDSSGPTLVAMMGMHLASIFRSVTPGPIVYLRATHPDYRLCVPSAMFADYFSALAGHPQGFDLSRG